MAQTLAVRGRTSIEAVREALGALAERDRSGEVLTAIKHFPAREAAFAIIRHGLPHRLRRQSPCIAQMENDTRLL